MGQGVNNLNKEEWRHSRRLSRVQSLRLADRSDMGTKGKTEIQGHVQVLVEGHWVDGGVVNSDGKSRVWEN